MMLRNLMTLEENNREELNVRVTAYCLFMSQLASTVSDVELLVKKGIIVHALRTASDAAEMLASLCSGVVVVNPDEPKHNYLHQISKNLEETYVNRRRTQLRRNHCANPWVLIALVVAFLGFASGIFQSVYSALSYYNKSERC
ncbi:hypothetical protein E2562_013019 [Oryza meyeriana var. granulata]|uniref:Uncharacterized protein n=1 Tax=Oryza meyeriana var. granulata TaxID=110450 RepID=A0A6G1DIR0_9ORYZ|nr:hypothetical protein E2562_013019 [Oryza meyeriana var. granulata]